MDDEKKTKLLNIERMIHGGATTGLGAAVLAALTWGWNAEKRITLLEQNVIPIESFIRLQVDIEHLESHETGPPEREPEIDYRDRAESIQQPLRNSRP